MSDTLYNLFSVNHPAIPDPPEGNDLLQWALFYASIGLPVFPLVPKGKTPVISKKEGGNGCHDATCDPDIINAWWTKYPGANIGIATGNGLYVLDSDNHPEEGKFGAETLEYIQAQNSPLPDTWLVLSGNGGEHRYFLISPDSPITIDTDFCGLSGLDYRCNGGYVVAPPSIHPVTGRRYEWECSTDFTEAPAAIPSWLENMILTSDTQQKKKSSVPGTSGTVAEKFISGSREVLLFKLACSLRHTGISEEEIYGALSVTNQKRCEPPLSDAELKHACKSAIRYEAGDLPEVPDAELEANAREYISELSADDFSSDLPFDYIISIPDDRLRSRMMQLARVKAKECKVNLKYFDDQIQIAQKHAQAPDKNDPVKIALPSWLYTGEWQICSSGVLKETEKSWAFACRLPVYISQRFVDVDDASLQAELSFKQAGVWKKITVPLDMLSTNTKACGLFQKGLTVTSDNASLFVSFISELWDHNYHLMPEGISTKRCGYTSAGFVPYAEGITFAGEGGAKQIYEAVHQNGDPDESIKVIGEIRQMSTAARIMIASSLAAPLLKPLRLLPFIVHTWSSQSGTGKTVALMAAASVWADPSTEGRYIANFNSTAVSMALTAKTLCNLPLCIDELQLVRNTETLQSIIYMLCEGHEKSRGTADSKLRDDTGSWCTTAICTGEMPILGDSTAQGSVNRCLEIEVPSGETVIDTGRGNELVNRLCDNYGIMGAIWVHEIMRPEILARVKELHAEIMQYLIEADVSEKQASSAAILCVADYAAGRNFWKEDNGHMELARYFRQHLKKKADTTIGKKAYPMVQDWIISHQNDFDRYAKPVAGVIKENAEGHFTAILGSVLKKALVEMGYQENQYHSILHEWASNNLIVTDSKGNVTKSVDVYGFKQRCVVFRWIPPDDDT